MTARSEHVICRARPATISGLNRREAKALRTRAAASEIIAPLLTGAAEHVFALTAGQASQIDFVLAFLDGWDVEALTVWTWAVADYELLTMSDVCNRANGLDFRLIVDRSCVLRQPQFLKWFGDRFGLDQIRVTRSHAKIATIRARDGRRAVIRGSMNLNENPRCENVDISTWPEVADCIAEVERELWEKGPPVTAEDLQFTKVNAQFEALFGECGDAPSRVQRGSKSADAQAPMSLTDIEKYLAGV